MAAGSSTGVVTVALACNLAIALAKFAAAAWTGSSAMLAAAIHSLADSGSQGLLLLGIRRSKRRAETRRREGDAKELYFWSFVVAILLYSLGAGIALYEGVHKLLDPRPLTDPLLNYAVLAVAAGLAGGSTASAIAELNHRRGDVPALVALRASKDPALLTVLLENAAALAGLTVASIGIAVSHITGSPAADAYAAILIGLLLGAVAAFMSVETRRLILGEAASAAVCAEDFFIEDEQAPDPARPGSTLPTPAIETRAAPANPAAAQPRAPSPATPLAPADPLSRKERKRQKHLKRP